ncbi:MAG: hypothetical protein WA118_14720 [Carboxydocellales bacterium]|jgi:hypothetical protein
MRIYFNKAMEHLPYILSSAVWHYLQAMDKLLNASQDEVEIEKLKREMKVIKEIINPAVKTPLEGEQFKIECQEVELSGLLVRILHHYLEETKDILRTIEDPTITKLCLQDVDIIENQLITAIGEVS